MNLINLKRMFNHILLNVPEEKINMSVYRTGSCKKHKCGSAGCVIGHSTILDNWENIALFNNFEINFEYWAYKFTGLESHSYTWQWCFSSRWPDEKDQILLRLKYLIDNQHIPSGWTKDCNFNYLLPQQKLEPYELNEFEKNI